MFVMLTLEASHRNHSFNMLPVLKRNVSGLDNAGCEMKSGHLIIAGLTGFTLNAELVKIAAQLRCFVPQHDRNPGLN